MINSEFLIMAGIVTALLWIPAGMRLYKTAVPIHWLFSVTFIFGSLGVAMFYYEKEYGFVGLTDFIMLSRVLWAVVLLTTATLAFSILVYRR